MKPRFFQELETGYRRYRAPFYYLSPLYNHHARRRNVPPLLLIALSIFNVFTDVISLRESPRLPREPLFFLLRPPLRLPPTPRKPPRSENSLRQTWSEFAGCVAYAYITGHKSQDPIWICKRTINARYASRSPLPSTPSRSPIRGSPHFGCVRCPLERCMDPGWLACSPCPPRRWLRKRLVPFPAPPLRLPSPSTTHW